VSVRLFPRNSGSDQPHRPYIIDLESTNGTKVNDQPVPSAQYYELQVNDGTCFLSSTELRDLTGRCPVSQ
jgi:pSer/pThr/pTyr-binding forkhead associated (FHA) protein